MIERKIHQIIVGETMRPFHKIVAETWRKLNPDWQYRIWKENDAQDLLFMNFSSLYAFCQSLPMQHKLHIYKYAVLYAEGGVVTDLDKECVQPVEHIIDPASNFYVSNDYKIMASSWSNPQLKKLLVEISGILNKYGILDEYADNEFGELLIKRVMSDI